MGATTSTPVAPVQPKTDGKPAPTKSDPSQRSGAGDDLDDEAPPGIIGNLTLALTDLFARPYNQVLTVPGWLAWLAFILYLGVTAGITYLVYHRFYSSAPCSDQILTLDQLANLHPRFDVCTFQYGSQKHKALSRIGSSDGTGFTATFSFLNPKQLVAGGAAPVVPKKAPRPSLKPFYRNKTCSMAAASSFSVVQMTAALSSSGFSAVYPWVKCGDPKSNIFVQLTLRTNMNLKLPIYTGLRALYLDALYNGGFDRYAGSDKRTLLSVLQSTLNINIPIAYAELPSSTAAYIKFQNGTWPRPYQQWYPITDDDAANATTSGTNSANANPIVARFLHDTSLKFLTSASNGSSAALVRLLDDEITSVLTEGAVYDCQVCGNRDALNSFFATAPWCHLLAVAIFLMVAKALEAVDRTPESEKRGPPSVGKKKKKKAARRAGAAAGGGTGAPPAGQQQQQKDGPRPDEEVGLFAGFGGGAAKKGKQKEDENGWFGMGGGSSKSAPAVTASTFGLPSMGTMKAAATVAKARGGFF
ncbi:hypothetical protein DFJ73DRAFT_156433 [Zopfochytrium polystomum]|nr:hypothetical protein DFJ73DRAFT_156433 [Zopfochytrium polystomum]